MDNEYLNTTPKVRIVYLFGSITTILLMIYSLLTMVIMFSIGPAPKTAVDCFNMLQTNSFFGLLRLDVLTVFFMPLYYILFFALFISLKKVNRDILILLVIIVFAGTTLFLSSPSVFSLNDLSDKYALASSDIQKNQLISAGEAIIASDMWHGTGPVIGGLLIQIGAFIISIIMLMKRVFNKFTAIIGLLTFGFDLLHIIFSFFAPNISIIFIALAGPLYLIWFPLIGLRFFKLSKLSKIETT